MPIQGRLQRIEWDATLGSTAIKIQDSGERLLRGVSRCDKGNEPCCSIQTICHSEQGEDELSNFKNAGATRECC
jgi:hypothetical protein